MERLGYEWHAADFGCPLVQIPHSWQHSLHVTMRVTRSVNQTERAERAELLARDLADLLTTGVAFANRWTWGGVLVLVGPYCPYSGGSCMDREEGVCYRHE